MLGLHCYAGFFCSACDKVGATLWLGCAGFSLWWLLLLWSTGSRAQASVAAVHGLSCSVTSETLVLGPGIEPVSPALAGRF